MRRPDVELTDDAAQFVERHPELIARLAGQVHDGAPGDLRNWDAHRSQFRGYIRERRAFAGTGEAQAASQQFLARFAR